MTWQPSSVIFPDIELWAATWLRAALGTRAEDYADAFVSNKVPNPRRDRMVIVRRDGGTSRELRDRPRLSLRVWATTEQDATDLARLCLALLAAAPNGSPVLKVEQQSGPLPIPDESGTPLRLCVVEIHTRGETLT